MILTLQSLLPPPPAEVAAAGAGGEAAREADGAVPRPLGGS